MKATEKQQRYIFVLLGKAGYSTRYMDKKYKNLGATMNERSGSVADWVASLDIARASEVIETLRHELDHAN